MPEISNICKTFYSSVAAKITSKLFIVSSNWRGKKERLNRPFSAENSVR